MRILTNLTCFLAACSLATVGVAQQQKAQPALDRSVVATIDGEPVLAVEAQHEFNQAYQGRKLTDEEKKTLLAAALEQVIDRRLVLRSLQRTAQAASDQDVAHALEVLEKQLVAQKITLADHCRQIGLEVDDVRRLLLWRLTWQNYLTKYLTDENLQKYFDKHRSQFDGTQLRVAHILLKDAAQADEIRAQIATGKLAFADAAKQHSTGPSAKDGGDIGWIEHRQPMPEAFSKAAFDLQPGQVSQPVSTAFGIHLIQVLETKSGKKTSQDAAGELKPAVALFLFRFLADKERLTAKIERK